MSVLWWESSADGSAVMYGKDRHVDYWLERIDEWRARCGLPPLPEGYSVEGASGPTPHSAAGVANRVDGLISDVLAGRLSSEQKRGVRSALDRSDRIAPSSDAAVGKVVRG